MDRELRILAVRRHAVRARAFLEDVECLVLDSMVHHLVDEPVADELTRLGGLLLDVATVVGDRAAPPSRVTFTAPAA